MRPLRLVHQSESLSHLCERPRIAQAVERAAARRIVFVQAAAGSGKSVAVRQYLAGKNTQHTWIGIDPLRATLHDLVFDLALALGDPWRSSVASAIAQSAKGEDPAAQLARWLIANGPPTGTIVLDDLQHFEPDDPVWRFLSLCLRAPDIRWFFASRADMHLPVTSLILAGDAFAPLTNELLAFTSDEIVDAAGQQSLALDERAVQSILELTQGWAAGVAFALVSAAQNTDITRISFETRELAYTYFAEQYFDSLDVESRRALYVLALAPHTSLPVFETLRFRAPAALLRRLAARVSLLDRGQGGGLRLHDLFRDFVLVALERDDDARRNLPGQLARALEATDDIIGALELWVRVTDGEEALRVLRRHGVTLIEQGRFSLVERCVAMLPRTVQREDPTAIGLRAAIEHMRGEFGRALTLYERALQHRADDDFAWACAYRLALLRVNRWQRNAGAPVAQYVGSKDVERRAEALTLSALGSVVGDHHDEARNQIAQALALLDEIDNEPVHAKVLMRAAYIAFYTSDVEHIELYAKEAAERAERSGDFETATHCHSILYAHAYAHLKEYAVALHYAQQMQRAAERCGSENLRTSAIRAQFEIEAQRGREERLEALDKQLRRRSDGYRDSLPYLSGKALWSAWNGDFAHAVRLLFPLSVAQLPPLEQQAVFAQLAFYCAADKRADEADKYLESVGKGDQALNPVAAEYATMTAVYATLAMALLGRGKAARRFITPQRALFSGNDAQVHHALLTFSGSPDGAALERCGTELRQAGFGGLGRALIVLAEREATPRPRPLLTQAELAILSAIAKGQSPKEIANDTGRSYETVRSHIKTICRKLDCSGMLEAVAAARHLNLI